MTLPNHLHEILGDLRRRAPGDDARTVAELVRLAGKSGELSDYPHEDEVEAALRLLWAHGLVEYTQEGWRYGWAGPGVLEGVG